MKKQLHDEQLLEQDEQDELLDVLEQEQELEEQDVEEQLQLLEEQDVDEQDVLEQLLDEDDDDEQEDDVADAVIVGVITPAVLILFAIFTMLLIMVLYAESMSIPCIDVYATSFATYTL